MAPPPPRRPDNDVTDTRGALRREDLADELALKRAEERIAGAKGEPLAGGARWMLRRLRRRLFGARAQEKGQ